MEDDDYNIAEADKAQNNDNNANLEDEYGYEDEEEQLNEQNEDDNENDNNQDDEDEEEEEDDDDQEGNDDEAENENDEDNQGDDNNNEYDFGNDDSEQRNRGNIIRQNKKVAQSSDDDDEDDEDDNENEEDDDEDEDDDDDQGRGKVRSRQVGKRGRFTRTRVNGGSPNKKEGKQLKDLKAGQQIRGKSLGEDDEEDNNEDMEEEQEDDEEDDNEDLQNDKSKNRDNSEGNNQQDDEEDDEDDNEDEEEDNENEEEQEDEQNQTGKGGKNKKQKKNEFWKFRHKNKDDKFKSPSSVHHQIIQNSIPTNLNAPVPTNSAIQEESILSSNNLNANSSQVNQANSQINYSQLSAYDEEKSFKFALKSAAKFNQQILSQKTRVSEMIKYHERNKQLQNKPIPIELRGGNSFPQNVPINAITEDGWKYLLNPSSFCQKTTLEEFIHQNVQKEHNDPLADMKKQPLPKNKSIKKKITKKNTFGADIYS